MSADPTYLAMLKTPEARSVWEKVLEMRGLPAPMPMDMDDWTFWNICAPPHLGELWELAEQRELCYLQVCKESEGITGRYQVVGGGTSLPLRVADGDSPQAALLSYLVGREWDAATGKWKGASDGKAAGG